MPYIRPLVFAVAILLAAAPAARADGDPASDFLAQQDVYYGVALDLKTNPAAQLPALLEESRKEGYEVKVAAISRFEDLGVVTFMWRAPKDYAEFLGQELGYIYKGRTLILMPNGYGIFHLGHSNVREQRILDKLPPPRKPEQFLPGAIDAVRRLAAASGVKLTVPDVEAPAGGVIQPAFQHPTAAPTATGTANAARTPARPGARASSGSGAWLFMIPVVAFVLAAAFAIVRSRLRARAA